MSIRSLYVGNLAPSATEASLKAAFAAYAPTTIRMAKNRGFAYIEIPEDQTERALKGMNGRSLDGRVLAVSEANPYENAGILRDERSRSRRVG